MNYDLNENLLDFHKGRYVISSNEFRVTHEEFLASYHKHEGLQSAVCDELGISKQTYLTRSAKLGLHEVKKLTPKPPNIAKKLYAIMASSATKHPDKEHDIQACIEKLKNQPLVCALTGLPLEAEHKSLVDYSYVKGTMSVDRIDSKLGYVPENVRLVHKTVNMLIGSIPDHLLYHMSAKIADNLRSKYVYNASLQEGQGLP